VTPSQYLILLISGMSHNKGVIFPPVDPMGAITASAELQLGARNPDI
jgi:hypothetical protein